MKAVVLLSGGMDSAVCLALARCEFECIALSFDYGQRHARRELDAAAWQARGLRHYVLTLPLLAWGNASSLTDTCQPVPAARASVTPSTYVPARNTVFLACALACAEAEAAADIFIGANALDYAGYPDCRPEYIAAFEAMSEHATRMGRVLVHAPLLRKTKVAIVALGRELGVDFARTYSCYAGGDAPCRQCDACVLRAEAGV